MQFEEALKKVCAEYEEVGAAFDTPDAWLFGYAIKMFAPPIIVDKKTGKDDYLEYEKRLEMPYVNRIDLSQYDPDKYMDPANYSDFESAKKFWLTPVE